MIELRTFDDPRAYSDALAHAVNDALKASLAAKGAADASVPNAHATLAVSTLAVSGGTSPKPFLQTLSRELLDWAHIDVTLVDDRWVPESDSASNARLVRETLLQHAAAAAYFLPLVDISKALETHVAELNADTRIDCRTSSCSAWARTATRHRFSPTRPSGTSPSRRRSVSRYIPAARRMRA